ncbi:MAG: sensor domain-containing diguanylate cyclase [Xylophilus ampelinus]
MPPFPTLSSSFLRRIRPRVAACLGALLCAAGLTTAAAYAQAVGEVSPSVRTTVPVLPPDAAPIAAPGAEPPSTALPPPARPMPSAYGAPSLALGAQPSYDLSPSMQVLRDPGGSLTIDDVARPPHSLRFQGGSQKPGGVRNFGLSRDAIWLRMDLTAAPGGDGVWLLEAASPSLDDVRLFVRQGDGSLLAQASGDRRPFALRPFVHRNHVFPLTLAADAPVTVFLRVQSEGMLTLPVRLWRMTALWEHDQRSYAALALYFGVLAALTVYNLLLFLLQQGRLHLVYAAMAAAMGVGQAGLTGFAGQFLWPADPRWTHLSAIVGIALSAGLGCLFVHGFLRQTLRRMRLSWMPTVLAVVFAGTAAWAATTSYRAAAWSLIGLLVALSLLATAAAAVGMRHREPGIRFFLAAWAALLAGTGVLLLHSLGLVPSNPLTSQALMVGSAVHLLLLSLALPERAAETRQMREKKQAAAIAATQHMVDTLQDSERRLEARIAERSWALELAYTHVREKGQVLEREANHDLLTGLPNRRMLLARLRQAIGRAGRGGPRFALAAADLDRFKAINDIHGHAVGDLVLAEVGKRLGSAIRIGDTAARMGGDEFVLLFEPSGSPEHMEGVCQKLQALVSAPIRVTGVEEALEVGISIGVAFYPDDATTLEGLMEAADRAMYQAKGMVAG